MMIKLLLQPCRKGCLAELLQLTTGQALAIGTPRQSCDLQPPIDIFSPMQQRTEEGGSKVSSNHLALMTFAGLQSRAVLGILSQLPCTPGLEGLLHF